ncbi:hypothetical protein JZ751_002019 [Albula glossodonta]|uniref:Uncharacterized protein n=1 Tax=Albula glossodonta TaxID=121402 RepID=A0A8T2P6V7_9TELE|nr:hypothetical protein JZ751_002019 [Albula glossodonta]
MHRAFSFPMTVERSRNKERLEASLAGLCELELLKQRQECLVLSALSLGDTVPGHPAWGDLQPPLSAPTCPSRMQDDLTLRRQLIVSVLRVVIYVLRGERGERGWNSI